MLLPSLAIGLLLLALVLAAAWDVGTLTIPNWLTFGLALAFLPAAWMTGLGWTQTGIYLATGLAMFVFAAILFYSNVFGGGDAKLLAAGAFWLGPSAIGTYLIGTALAGGALALAILVARRLAPEQARTSGPVWRARLLNPRAGVPYGVAIATGAFLALEKSSTIGMLALSR